MVVPLGPGKFYGSSLPRPRFYTDVKFNSDRVDPPVPVMDPFLSWANEAHWSMGGLSFKRLRLQGRIEGNIEKLRAEHEKLERRRHRKAASKSRDSAPDDEAERGDERDSSVSPPPAPIAVKRRRYMALIDDEVEEGGDNNDSEKLVEGSAPKEKGDKRKRLARKLNDDFDRMATESEGRKKASPIKKVPDGGSGAVAAKTRKRRSEAEGGVGDEVMKVVKELNACISKAGSEGRNDSTSVKKFSVGGSEAVVARTRKRRSEMDGGVGDLVMKVVEELGVEISEPGSEDMNKVDPVKKASVGGAEAVAARTRKRRSEVDGGVGDVVMKVIEEVNAEVYEVGENGPAGSRSASVNRVRASSRLAKRRQN